MIENKMEATIIVYIVYYIVYCIIYCIVFYSTYAFTQDFIEAVLTKTHDLRQTALAPSAPAATVVPSPVALPLLLLLEGV